MYKKSLVFVVVFVLAFPVFSCAEENKHDVTKKVKDSRSIVKTILAILGVSIASGGLKGESDVSEGELWIIDITDKSTKKVAKKSSFKSPIFHGEKNEIFALSKGQLVQFKKSYGLEEPIKLFSVPNISKLLDSNLSDNELLIIDKNNTIGILSLDSQQTRLYSYDKKLDEHKELMNYVNGWFREYNNTTISLYQVVVTSSTSPTQKSKVRCSLNILGGSLPYHAIGVTLMSCYSSVTE